MFLTPTSRGEAVHRRRFAAVARKVRALWAAGQPVPPALLVALLEWSEHTYTLAEGSSLLLRLMPTAYREPPPPAAPVSTFPGSPERVEQYRRRRVASVGLHHENDTNAGDAQAANAGPTWLSEDAEPHRLSQADRRVRGTTNRPESRQGSAEKMEESRLGRSL